MQDGNPVFQWGKSFVDRIDLTHSKTILDIGCRRGDISAYLANVYHQKSITAIDNLQTEIEQTHHHRISNLSFEKADVLSLGCTEHFDAVVSFSCLHWIHNKTNALQNIYQTLKPGGKAYLQFFALHGRQKNDRFLYQTASVHPWKSYFKKFVPEYSEITFSECSTLLQALGFIIHQCQFVSYKTDFTSESLHSWFTTWAHTKQCIPLKKQDHFLADTVQAYLKAHNYLSNDKFHYYEYVLEVICEKPQEIATSQEYSSFRYGVIEFTKQEARVLKYFLQGKSAKEISSILVISAKTVEFHLGRVKEKLNCHRRSEIYQAALSTGFIQLIFNMKL